MSSAVVEVKAQYSALAVDLEIVAHFLALQERRFGPINITKPVVERQSSREPAQSTSQNPVREVNKLL